MRCDVTGCVMLKVLSNETTNTIANFSFHKHFKESFETVLSSSLDINARDVEQCGKEILRSNSPLKLFKMFRTNGVEQSENN